MFFLLYKRVRIDYVRVIFTIACRCFGQINSNKLFFLFSLAYDQVGSIGKRYARQDLIGTPYCITVDHQTLEDNTVTVRERDGMTQVRLSIEELERYLDERVSMKVLLKDI